MTNALNIAQELVVRPYLHVMTTGGVGRPQSYELVGPVASPALPGQVGADRQGARRLRRRGAAVDADGRADRHHARGHRRAGFGAPEEVLFRGSGWGALEVEAGAFEAAAGLPFGVCSDEQLPWVTLLALGRLPVCEPPAASVIGPRWRELLEETAADWHALYHLGLMRLADGDDDGARDAFKRSAGDRPTAYALRALAFLATSAAETADLMAEAHRLLPGLRELTVETLRALLAANRATEALAVIEALPDDDRSHGRIRLAEANASSATGDLDRVRRLLAEGIRVDNLREGEDSLDALWLSAHPDRPVPAEYDFRMSEG